MNTTTYILTGGNTTDSVYIDGSTAFTLSFANILSTGHYSGTQYSYLKCLVQFSDDPAIHTVHSLTDWYQLADKTLTHTFYPTSEYVTSHTVNVTGFRTDLSIDNYSITLNQRKTNILDYGKYKIINTRLMTNDSGKNELLVTLELQDPRHIANIVVPYDKVIVIGDTGDQIVPGVMREWHLRTERYSDVGEYQAIVTENHRDYIIREIDLVIIVIGTENHGHYSTTGTTSECIVGAVHNGATMIVVPEDITYLQNATVLLNRGRETY